MVSLKAETLEPPVPGSVAREWKTNWPVVMVSAAGIGLSAAHIYTMGIFMAPVCAEYGWTRAQYSSAMTITAVVSFFCSPLVGMLVDRLGPRRIGLCGVVVFCGAFALLATTGESIWHWWVNWLLVAFGLQFVKATVWTSAVASAFASGRGVALAVTLSGSGVASIIDPMIANHLIETVGWRGAYVGYAAFWALLTLPLCIFFLYGAKDRQRLKKKGAPGAVVVTREGLTGLHLKDALRSARFYKLAGVALLTNMMIMALIIHFIPLLTSGGMGRTSAVSLAGLIGVAAIIGRLGAGFLFDRFSGALVGAAIVVMPAIACGLLLANDGSVIEGAIIACVIGCALGADLDLVTYLSSRYFGLRNFGAVLGFMIAALNVGEGAGPLLAGAVFDAGANYTAFLWMGMPTAFIAAVLMVTLGPYPSFPPADAPEATPLPGSRP